MKVDVAVIPPNAYLAGHVNVQSTLDGTSEIGQSPALGAGLRSIQTTRQFSPAGPPQNEGHDVMNTPPDLLRQSRQRVHSDTSLLAAAAHQARSGQNLFSGVDNSRGHQARAEPPRVTKRLPSGSPLRRGNGSWDKNAPGWGALTSGPNASTVQHPRHTASAHGQRSKWGNGYPGRDLDRNDIPNGSPGSPGWGPCNLEKTHLTKFHNDDKTGWMGAAAGTIGREWVGRGGTKAAGVKGNGKISSAHFAHDSLALTTTAVPGMDSSPRSTSFKQRPATGAPAPMPALAR